jgi:glycerol-3-phosphate dehydrogenase
MRPLRFIMPHDSHLRPAWMIRAGLFLYDHLARRAHLAASASVDLRTHIAGGPLKAGYRRGFVYSDGWVDDARLVVLNALDAQARGATVLTRVRCEQLTPEGAGWSATLRARAGAALVVRARAVVNTSRPWVSEFVTQATPVRAAHAVRLVVGVTSCRAAFDHRH